MSSTTEITPQNAADSIPPNATQNKSSLRSRRRRQISAVMRLEIKKNFLSRRAALLYLIAGLPLVLLSLFALFRTRTGEAENFGEVSIVYRGDLRRIDSSHAGFFRLRVGFYESVPRRSG